MTDPFILSIIENPSENIGEIYESFVNQKEYSLLQETEQYPYKSQEYFNKRREAFAFRREFAIKMINTWVGKYGTSKGCPVTYADTLNIPFREIKQPKSVNTEQAFF